MNKIGFLADLSENTYKNIIKRNKSIDKLLEIVSKKCEEASLCFDNISDCDEETIRDCVKNFNITQKDVRAIVDCIRDYCALNNVNLSNYIKEYYSEDQYLVSIFMGHVNSKENQK